MLKKFIILMLFVVLLAGWTTASAIQTEATGDEQVELLMAKDEVIETVNQLFIATDDRDWDTVKSVFASEVLFDMTSLAGGEAVTLTPQEIVDSWDEGLADLEAIHHQVGNFIVDLNAANDEAEVFNYGIAIHYLPNSTGENTRTFVGSYNFRLVKTDADWQIDQFQFNAKYVDGNLDLEADAAADRITQLPVAVQCYINAVNAELLDPLMDCFGEDAKLVDVSRSIDGVDAIRTWADSEVIGGRLEILETVEQSEDSVKLLVTFAPGGVGGFQAHYEFNYADELITGMDLQYAP